MLLSVKKFREGPVFRHSHLHDIGYDVFLPTNVSLTAHSTISLNLGFGIELPEGAMGLIMPRTSMSKRGLLVHSCPIDPRYTGEVHAIVTNTTDRYFEIHTETAIAQLVIVPFLRPTFTYQDQWVWHDGCSKDPKYRLFKLTNVHTDRGDNWNGSTNTNPESPVPDCGPVPDESPE